MRSKHFGIYELVPQELYETVHEDVLWEMVPDELILSIDAIKSRFWRGSMSINTYKWNGDRNWSGLRTKESPWYSPGSQHTLFKATDSIFSSYDVDDIREYIIANPEEFPHIKGIELGVSWLHIDVRSRDTLLQFSA